MGYAGSGVVMKLLVCLVEVTFFMSVSLSLLSLRLARGFDRSLFFLLGPIMMETIEKTETIKTTKTT